MGTLLFLNIGVTEILIVLFVVLLLFGGRKLPELMHGLGKGIKVFKEEMKGAADNGSKEQEKE